MAPDLEWGGCLLGLENDIGQRAGAVLQKIGVAPLLAGVLSNELFPMAVLPLDSQVVLAQPGAVHRLEGIQVLSGLDHADLAGAAEGA